MGQQSILHENENFDISILLWWLLCVNKGKWIIYVPNKSHKIYNSCVQRDATKTISCYTEVIMLGMIHIREESSMLIKCVKNWKL